MNTGIVVPVYNHADHVGKVIESLLSYGLDIIVVDDGSQDDVQAVLKKYGEKITVISYMLNRGKGYALRQAFAFAKKNGWDHALTIDADGQHKAEDIPFLLDAMRRFPDAMILGCRSFDHPEMPSKNTFANRFSNFWFWVQTGKKLPDTQTGFRIYPLLKMDKMKFLTSRYEAELEMLVRLAWRDVDMIPVPVQVYYSSSAKRNSHFRPFVDFLRISVLNTVFTIVAFVYAYPCRGLRAIKNVKK